LNRTEPHSSESQSFLEYVYQLPLPTFSPTLLLVEVASAIARVFNDSVRGIAFAQSIRLLPGQVLVPLDEALASEAGRSGAERRLRGADAIYAAVAQRNGTTLVTLDQQQLEHLSGYIKVQRPGEVLRSLTKQG
jgi:predicted nucleic acid-binding protein